MASYFLNLFYDWHIIFLPTLLETQLKDTEQQPLNRIKIILWFALLIL